MSSFPPCLSFYSHRILVCILIAFSSSHFLYYNWSRHFFVVLFFSLDWCTEYIFAIFSCFRRSYKVCACLFNVTEFINTLVSYSNFCIINNCNVKHIVITFLYFITYRHDRFKNIIKYFVNFSFANKIILSFCNSEQINLKFFNPRLRLEQNFPSITLPNNQPSKTFNSILTNNHFQFSYIKKFLILHQCTYYLKFKHGWLIAWQGLLLLTP